MDPLEELRESATTSVEIARRVLGLGRTAAYEAVKRGDLPSIRIGRRIVIPTAPLLRLLDG